ncbi:MAG: anti-sigma factor family protein, partial [Pseudomonadota bacterium]
MTKKDSDIKFFNGVKERDIHAYIDGHLDPRREKMVEAYLDRHPEIAEEVRDYVEYNNLLKQAYVPLEEEEVPARLMAVLNRPVRNYWQPMMRVAAVVALCALSVGLGRVSAYQGEGGAPSDDMVNHFLQQIASNDTEGLYNEASMGQLELDTNVETDPLNWLTQKIALEMQAPDLSSAGYMMTGRRLVTRGTQEFVELTYKGQDGGDAKLYLKTRWDKKPPSIEFA